MKKNQIFISYASADKDIVWPFVQKLEGRLHVKCWIDKDKFQVGEDFRKTIYDGIDNCDAVLFMLSDAAIESPYTREEIDYATGKAKRIIPLLIDGKPLRDWALETIGNVYYVDINRPDSVDILIRNLREWYPNIGNEYYLKLAKDYLAEHPKGLSYAVEYWQHIDDWFDIRIISLDMADVEKIRSCAEPKQKDAELIKRIEKKYPEIIKKISHPESLYEIEKIRDYDKDMLFVQCNVAVFENGLGNGPKLMHIPVSMTVEDYEELLAWKLEWRGRDIFDLHKAMPVLSDSIISEVKSCRYLRHTNEGICHPFALEIDELEKDAYDLLGERELELLVYNAKEDEESWYFCVVGEWLETILQIYERHLVFGLNSSEGRYMIEVDDAIAVQEALEATCYRDVGKIFEEKFGGEHGVVIFKGWLEGHNIPYVFTDGDCPEIGNFYSSN